MDEMVSPAITLHGSGLEVPCMVVVDKEVDFKSDEAMSRVVMIDGSKIVILAWSSIIAKPSTVNPVFGCVNSIGHVLLYEDTRKIVPWAYF